MTITVRYSLDEFVHDMSALVDEQPDQERLFDRGSSYLERLINNPDAVPEEYRIPAIRNGRRANHGTYVLHYGDNGLLVTISSVGARRPHRSARPLHLGHDRRDGQRHHRDPLQAARRPLPRRLRSQIEKDRETLVQARRRQPAGPRGRRDPPDGQPLGHADGRDTRVRQRPERPTAQQVQPRDKRGQALRHHPLRQLLVRGKDTLRLRTGCDLYPLSLDGRGLG